MGKVVGATDASGNTSGTGGDGQILGWRYVLRTKYTFGTGEIMGVQGKDAEIKGYILLINGAPGRIRTCDLRIRSPLLYPTELQAHYVYF